MTIDHFYENIYTCKFDKFFFFANLGKVFKFFLLR